MRKLYQSDYYNAEGKRVRMYHRTEGEARAAEAAGKREAIAGKIKALRSKKAQLDPEQPKPSRSARRSRKPIREEESIE